MKDIKELIYAAVEENALKFQELVNNQLQVRAYEAIESLRPEIGASMFGESSHKKMNDDEDDEDKKKSKVEEELKGNQHKIDKNKNGKIDGHDFKLLRQEEVVNELSSELLQRTAKAASARSQAFKSERDRIAKMPHQQRDAPERAAKMKTYDKASSHYANLANKANVHKSNMADTMKHKEMQTKLPAKMKNTSEEVINELSAGLLDRASKAASARSDDFKSEKNRIAAMPHQQRDAPEREAKQKTYAKASDHYGGLAGKISRHKSNMADKLKAKSMQAKLPAKMRNTSEEVDLDEVAMPKNAADWQALINHQIKTTGHPVGTDAQFRAQHGKDTSKIASQHSPEDMLNYATAQGGTVKQ